MFEYALRIFIFLSPILFLPLNIPGVAALQFYQFGHFGTNVNISQLQIFQGGAAALLMASFFDKQKRLFQDKFSGLLFLMCILSVYIHPKTISNFPTVLFGFLIYYLVYSYVNLSHIKIIFKIIAFVAAINTFFAILQYFNVYLIYRPKAEIFGLMSYKTHLGIYEALSIPICYAINPFLSIVPITGLMLSGSATSIIPAIIGMVFFHRKNIIKIQSPPMLICFFGFIVILVIKSFQKFSLRFDVWIQTLGMIKEKLVLGHGIGIFKYVDTRPWAPIEYTDPYSLYLSILHAIGIAGFIIFLFFICNHFISMNDSLYTCAISSSCLILLITGLGYSFLNYPRLAGTAIILFGLLKAAKGDSYENQV